jgi:hypothetical protein
MIERIEQLKAHTLAGVDAKATVLLHWHWAGRDVEDLDDQERLVAEIVERLVRQRSLLDLTRRSSPPLHAGEQPSSVITLII